MDLEILGPMLVGITFIVTTGGVILLRPISKRLGDLIEMMAQERRDPRLREGLDGIRELLEHQGSRLDLLERRQDFAESLLTGPRSEEQVSPPPRPKVLPED